MDSFVNLLKNWDKVLNMVEEIKCFGLGGFSKGRDILFRYHLTWIKVSSNLTLVAFNKTVVLCLFLSVEEVFFRKLGVITQKDHKIESCRFDNAKR